VELKHSTCFKPVQIGSRKLDPGPPSKVSLSSCGLDCLRCIAFDPQMTINNQPWNDNYLYVTYFISYFNWQLEIYVCCMFCHVIKIQGAKKWLKTSFQMVVGIKWDSYKDRGSY
jgi:hypothetical protein